MIVARRTLILLLLILLIGSAIRLYHPTFRSLWGDEVDSVFRIYAFSAHNFNFERSNFLETITRSVLVPLKGHHLPGYFMALSLWTYLFGVGEFSLRLLSIIFGILSIPLTFLLAREMFEERTALISAFLFSISGFAVFYSQEIRPYSFMLFFSLLSIFFYWKLIRREKRTSLIIGYILSSICLALSHLFGALIIMAQVVYLLIDLWKECKLSKIIIWGIMLGLIALAVFPFYLNVLSTGIPKLMAIGEELPFTTIPAYLKVLLSFFVLSVGESVAPWNLLIAIPAGLVFGYLFIRSFWKLSDKRIVFLLVLCLLPILFASLFVKLTMPKYLIITLPYYLILIGYSISQLSARSFRYAAVLIVFLVQALSIFNYFSLKEYHNANQLEPWREVSNIISIGFRSKDVILASSYDIIYRDLEYYLNISGGNSYFIYIVSFGDREQLNPGNSDGNYPLLIADIKNLNQLKASRIWLITHIRDSRKLPPGAVNDLKRWISRHYKLIMKKDFVPYDQTLVSKLPFIKHDNAQNRISLELYDTIEKKYGPQ